MISKEAFERVAVVGTSCSGKTSLAASLASALHAPHIELDSLYWGPNWTPISMPAHREKVDAATAQERWVCDGNYSIVRDLVWPRATAVVWLNYRFPVVFGRALRRTLYRCFTGAALYSGNRETFGKAFFSRDSILLWVLKTHAMHRREYPRKFREPAHSHLHIVELRSPRDADRLLQEVGSASASTFMQSAERTGNS